MFRFQRQCEAIDDAAQNLKEFANTIKVFSFVYEPEKYKVFKMLFF